MSAAVAGWVLFLGGAFGVGVYLRHWFGILAFGAATAGAQLITKAEAWL